ncbi:MAG: hypothetical protein V9G19_23840 [Tetrasphaera sp.]
MRMMLAHLAVPAADAPEKLTNAGQGQLLIAAVLGIAAVVLLISWAKFHPFLALILGAAVMGFTAGVKPAAVVDSASSPASARPPGRWACWSPSGR